MELFIESIKAIGNILFNPIFYWIILLIWLPSYQRIERERNFFNNRVFDVGSELTNTLVISIGMTIFLLAFTLGIGVIFTYELIIILSVIIIILTYKNSYTLLSASYTLGFTYLIMMFLPSNSPEGSLSDKTFISITLLIGIFLIAEAIMLFTIKNDEAFPKLAYSKRGRWYGRLQLTKMGIIPFVVLVPSESIISESSFWPYFFIGEQSFSLFLMPFAVGFNHITTSKLPAEIAKRLGAHTFILAIIIIGLSGLSFTFPELSMITVIIAIIGRAYIQFKHYQTDSKKPPYFIEGDPELKVLGVISSSPAQKLGFNIGDTIITINDQAVDYLEDFDEILQQNKGLFSVQVKTANRKIRVIENETFHGDRLELGILFATKPVNLLER